MKQSQTLTGTDSDYLFEYPCQIDRYRKGKREQQSDAYESFNPVFYSIRYFSCNKTSDCFQHKPVGKNDPDG